MSDKLTAAQRKWLLRSDAHGHIVSRSSNGLMRTNWEGVMKLLVVKGYLRPYAHGGYELTDLGRMFVIAERRYDSPR